MVEPEPTDKQPDEPDAPIPRALLMSASSGIGGDSSWLINELLGQLDMVHNELEKERKSNLELQMQLAILKTVRTTLPFPLASFFRASFDQRELLGFPPFRPLVEVRNPKQREGGVACGEGKGPTKKN